MSQSDPQLNQVLLSEHSRVGPNLNSWLQYFGGEGLENALNNVEGIIDVIKEAGLLGLGGSGFPTYKKWQYVAEQQTDGDKYLICNGNEDEPGTFKDQLLLEETPHQVIEGATITALATGINKVIFYINPEQDASHINMREAVLQWQSHPLFEKVQAIYPDKTFEYQVVASSGHYIGGEETAAIESVEGNFPFPRGKPPFPAESGVYGCPTLINNIETLSNVSHILRKGAQWYRDLGVGDSAGIGGVAVDTIATDFGILAVQYAPQVSQSEILIVDTSKVSLAVLPTDGEALKVEELAKDGASMKTQLYGQFGTDYGHEVFHGKITNLA